MVMASPVAMSLEKSSAPVWATHQRLQPKNAKTMVAVPSRPISVPMAAKIMSLVSSGICPGE